MDLDEISFLSRTTIIFFRITSHVRTFCNRTRRRITASVPRKPLVFSGLRHGLAFRAGSYMDQHNTPSSTLQGIRRAFHPLPSAIQDIGVDHRDLHVLVPEQFLNGAYVVTCLQQMPRQGMAKRTSRNNIEQPCVEDSRVRHHVKCGFPLYEQIKPRCEVTRGQILTRKSQFAHPQHTVSS